jgi:transcription initiation factor TFIID subunit 2
MDMLTLCRVLYPVTDHYILKIPLPQFWRAEHLGHGKMKFTKTGRFRTHPVTTFESRFKKPAITKGAKRTNPSDETGEANGEAKRPRLSAEGPEEKSHIISFKVRTPASADPPPVVKREAPPPVAKPTPPPAAPPPLTVETQLLPPAPAPVQISAPPSTAASTPRSKPQPRRTLIVILKASQAVLRRFAPAPAALPSPDVFSFPSSDSEAMPLAAVAAAAKSKSKPAHGTAKAKHKFGKTGLSREGSSKSASGSPAPQQPVVVAAPPVVEKKSGFKIKLNLGKKA